MDPVRSRWFSVRGLGRSGPSALAQSLERRNSLGSPLQEIRLRAEWAIFLLRTKAAGPGELGPAMPKLLRRLELYASPHRGAAGQLKAEPSID